MPIPRNDEPDREFDVEPQPIDEATLMWAWRVLGGQGADLTTQEFANIRDTLRRVYVPAGSEIVKAGEWATHVFLIHRGSVELRRPFDHRHGVLSSLEPGGVFGDIPILLGRPHHLDAVARVDSELLMMRGQDLSALTQAVSAIASRWVWSLASRVLETHQRLDEMLAGHLDYQVAALLVRRCDGSGRVEITQAQLARLLGVQRSSVNGAVQRLERRGFLCRGYGYIDVIEPERLAALVRD